jgi:hypothetical protein
MVEALWVRLMRAVAQRALIGLASPSQTLVILLLHNSARELKLQAAMMLHFQVHATSRAVRNANTRRAAGRGTEGTGRTV